MSESKISNLVTIIFEIFCAIMLIILGIIIIINTQGIQLLLLVYSGFQFLLPTEIIKISGNAIIIIGIAFLALVPLITIKRLRKNKVLRFRHMKRHHENERDKLNKIIKELEVKKETLSKEIEKYTESMHILQTQKAALESEERRIEKN